MKNFLLSGIFVLLAAFSVSCGKGAAPVAPAPSGAPPPPVTSSSAHYTYDVSGSGTATISITFYNHNVGFTLSSGSSTTMPLSPALPFGPVDVGSLITVEVDSATGTVTPEIYKNGAVVASQTGTGTVICTYTAQ